ncbi:MAG: type 2 isopentenyl-diphosphate Delta-isomerase [Bdellovibrionia bacterium]
MKIKVLNTKQFEKRKADHIQHSLEAKNQAEGQNGLDRVHLVHEALPDLNFDEIDISTICIGKRLKTPFFVSGMTAGHADAPAINQLLASACESRGWAMGVGSQRRDLESLREATSGEWVQFRKSYQNLFLIGNLGISQVIRASVADIQKVTDLLEVDMLAVHTNALQEILQPEGTPQFKGCLKAIQRLGLQLRVPLLLKETGCGFSSSTLKKVSKMKLAAVDISGLGGTHWGRIEGARAEPRSLQALASQTFANWGESTVSSVIAGKKALPKKIELWATGGVRNGLDAAKLIALGAKRIGYAKPALEAALKGEKALHQWMEQQEFELKVALFCTGSLTPAILRKRKCLTK